jgi:hypothetical protein
MKNIVLFFFVIFLYGCDTFSGVTMQVNNIVLPIEKIYADIKENNEYFKYENIELKYVPPKEYFEIWPNSGKHIRESYHYISIWVYGFGATIKYIDSEKLYLFVDNRYLHGAPDEILQYGLYKINELKQFFIEEYGLENNNIIIDTYGIK